MEEKLEHQREEENNHQETEVSKKSSGKAVRIFLLLIHVVTISAVCALAYFGYSHMQIQELRYQDQALGFKKLELLNQETTEGIVNLGGKVSVLELVYQQATASQETIAEVQTNIVQLENQIARLEDKNTNLVENLSRLSNNMNDLLLSIEQERNILMHFKLQQKLMRLESLWSETLDNNLLAREITKLQQNQDLQDVLSQAWQTSLTNSLTRLESLKPLSLKQVLDSIQELENSLSTHRKNIFGNPSQHIPAYSPPQAESLMENITLWLQALWLRITFFDVETQAGIEDTQLLQLQHLENMQNLLHKMWLSLASQNFSLVDTYFAKIQQDYTSKNYQSILPQESLKLLPEQLEELRRRSASSLIY